MSFQNARTTAVRFDAESFHCAPISLAQFRSSPKAGLVVTPSLKAEKPWGLKARLVRAKRETESSSS